ncbi:MAG: YqaE/Pmp3 family membrane protein [Chitinophagaceae bacterium]
MKRLAILLPWFSFFLREKYTKGYICLALQITIIGWPIAAAWAFFTLISSGAKAKNNSILQSLQPSFYTSEMAMQNIA